MNEKDELFNKLTTFIQEINIKQTEDIKSYIKEETENIKITLNQEISKRNILERELEEVKTKCKILEKELRKNSIIIFNFDFKGGNDILDFTVEKLNRLLQLNINKVAVNNIYEVGRKRENKPIIVKFVSYVTKQQILKSCKKLKGTSISIAEHLSLEERNQQKILLQHLKQARSKNLNAYIKGEKLYINGEVYSTKELTENGEVIENEQEENNIMQKSSSAPPTPTHKAKIDEEINIEEEVREDKGSAAKKRKFTVPTSNILPGRSSSRLIEKEVKQAGLNRINSPVAKS